MKWYLVKRVNGGFQKICSHRRPETRGEIVFEHDDFHTVHEELMRLEQERFDAAEG